MPEPAPPGRSARERLPQLCVGAVARRGRELLMVRRGNEPGRGLWSVPGGRVEWGETVRHAVERELAEETSLEGTCGDLVGWTEVMTPREHFVVLDHEVTLTGDDRPTAGSDATEAAWMDLEALSELPVVPGLVEFLERHGILGPPHPRP